jgi:hypothetical protein
MLEQAFGRDLGSPVGASRHTPPALRQCCDSYVCPVCEQVVELTDFRQVVWHQRPDHRPMQAEG